MADKTSGCCDCTPASESKHANRCSIHFNIRKRSVLCVTSSLFLHMWVTSGSQTVHTGVLPQSNFNFYVNSHAKIQMSANNWNWALSLQCEHDRIFWAAWCRSCVWHTLGSYFFFYFGQKKLITEHKSLNFIKSRDLTHLTSQQKDE